MVLTTMLISIVEVSNVFSVLIVFSVFCVMVVFILRLHNEEFRMTSVTFSPRMAVQPLPMIKIRNPFVFNLKTSGDCSPAINDAVCTVSSQVPWISQEMWGVTIADLHPALNNSWSAFKEMIMSQSFIKDSCLQQGSLQHYSECKDKEVHFSPVTSVSAEDFGISPRTKYPLVVILIRHDDIEEESHEVGAIINIIHIRDDLCKMPSCVMAQYLKMTSGHLTTLKQLYVVSDESPKEEKDQTNIESDSVLKSESTEGEDQNVNLCVVCQSGPVTRALLPCRHVCSCRKCFTHLDKCPMCRSPISSYFCISEEAIEASETGQSEQSHLPLRQRLEQWNDWLNQMLGLT